MWGLITIKGSHYLLFCIIIILYNVLEKQLTNIHCAGQNDMVHVIIVPSQPINVIMNDFVR